MVCLKAVSKFRSRWELRRNLHQERLRLPFSPVGED